MLRGTDAFSASGSLVPSPENQSSISGAARSPRALEWPPAAAGLEARRRREPPHKVRSARGDRVSPEGRPPKPCLLSAPFLFVPPRSHSGASLVAQLVKNLQCGRPGFDPWVGEIPWERRPTPVFWPGESQRVGHDWATSLFHADADALMLPYRLAPIHPVLQPFLTSHQGAVSQGCLPDCIFPAWTCQHSQIDPLCKARSALVFCDDLGEEGWKRAPRGSGYMYTQSWCTWLESRNEQRC